VDKKVGWISASASTTSRHIGGCANAYPPYFCNHQHHPPTVLNNSIFSFSPSIIVFTPKLV
jgi:hypothetical protein